MADIKYLSLEGLTTYHDKIKSFIASSISDAHGDEIVSIANAVSTTVDGVQYVSFTYTKADNTTATFTIDKDTLDTVIGDASKTSKGLMTIDQVTALEKVVSDVANLQSGAILGHTQTVKADSGSLAAWNGSVDQTLTYDLTYDDGEKKIVLSIGDGTSTVTSSIDATDFIKDGMLSSADIVTIPDDEPGSALPAGKYIKLSWNTDAGIDATYIPVGDLISEHDIIASDDTTVINSPDSYVTAGEKINVTLNVKESTNDKGTKVHQLALEVDDSYLEGVLFKVNASGDDYVKATTSASGDTVTVEAQDVVKNVADAYESGNIAGAKVKVGAVATPDITTIEDSITDRNLDEALGVLLTNDATLNAKFNDYALKTDLDTHTAISNSEIEALFAS